MKEGGTKSLCCLTDFIVVEEPEYHTLGISCSSYVYPKLDRRTFLFYKQRPKESESIKLSLPLTSAISSSQPYMLSSQKYRLNYFTFKIKISM